MNLLFDPLHTHTGLLVFFVTLVVFRGFKSTALPLLFVIFAEVFILWGGIASGNAEAKLTISKFLSAIIWPFAIVALGRLGLLDLLAPPLPEAPKRP